MTIDDALKIKYQAQKRLDDAAEHDIKKYCEVVHKTVLEAEKDFGITIRYGKPAEELVETVNSPTDD